MTLTYKGHKDPPENRIVIRCEDFETNNKNFHRKMYNSVTDFLGTVQVRYLCMVEERAGGQKKESYNLVDDIQKAAKWVSSIK